MEALIDKSLLRGEEGAGGKPRFTMLETIREARRLFLSPRTVNAHLNSVYRKLGVGSRSAATRLAFEYGLA